MVDASTAASALGHAAKGVPKTLSAAERERRRRSMAEAREKRWPKKPTTVRETGPVGESVHRPETVANLWRQDADRRLAQGEHSPPVTSRSETKIT